MAEANGRRQQRISDPASEFHTHTHTRTLMHGDLTLRSDESGQAGLDRLLGVPFSLHV
ncbi:hypothetical protein BR93DRAFT_924837 [Coniochaeta sp. PMI_546]|nr:hypothetical protein BR93DRAFT_924837 [Coniochaeta sp. PMI_546]